jgi:hypothetical protein
MQPAGRRYACGHSLSLLGHANIQTHYRFRTESWFGGGDDDAVVQGSSASLPAV